MKKNFLLSLALMFAATATQAQVMYEDFSAAQTKAETDPGWYEFINTQEGDERTVEKGVVHFYNSDQVEGQSWMRAIKFRNLPIKENTSYRVKFKLSGDDTYNMDGSADQNTRVRYALMQGGENLDMGFLGSNGSEQINDANVSYDERTYVGMYYYTTDAAQKAWYAERNPGKDELPATYFLTINVYNPGDFDIDDVLVEEANIQGIAYRDDVIRVDFGYAINAAAVLNGQTRVLMPNDCVTVKLNGEEVNVLSVELFSNGRFYIFLDEDYPSGPGEDVEVSFTNPTDPAYRLQYAAGLTPGGDVFDFAGEKGAYDDDLEDVYSFVFVTPTLVSADPENGSFNLPVSTNEFKFVFDKDIDCSLVEATFDGVKMTAAPADGLSKEVTFTREAGDAAVGVHMVKVTKVYPEIMLDPNEYGELNFELSFGHVDIDPNDTIRVVMTDGFDEAGAGNYPVGWQVMSDNQLRQTEADGWSSGSRLIGGKSGDITTGLYLCSRSGSEGYAWYGANEPEDEKLHLTPGKYQLTFQCAKWDTDEQNAVRVQVCDAADNVIAEEFTLVEPRVDNSQHNTTGATKVTVNFVASAEGNYVLKFYCLKADGNPGGWGDGIFLGNVQLKYLPAAVGVDETNLLNTALANAKTTLNDNGGERYLGVDYDNLKATIEKHDGKADVYTAPSQFKAAAAELDDAADALKAHVSLCNTYDPLVENAIAARDARTDTKYAKHPGYAALVAAIEKYEGKVLTDNAELTEAIAALQNSTATMNKIERVTENYLYGINSGIATLEKLGASEEKLTNEAAELLDDNAAVKQSIQVAIAQAVNKQMADPNVDLFAPQLDEETLEEGVPEYDLSVFINNPEIYYTANDDKSTGGSAWPSTENIPGWTLTEGEGWTGGFTFHYPWGADAQYAYNADNCPNANGMIASWSFGYDIEQTIENLPAGQYKLTFGVGERDEANRPEPTSYVYGNTTDKEYQTVIPVIAGSVEPYDNAVVEGIIVTDGKLTIGFHQDSEDQTFFNNVHLYLVGGVDGHDYAGDVTSIADVEKAATVNKIELFDLNGRRVNNGARGVIIVKKTMSDGTVVNQKVVK